MKVLEGILIGLLGVTFVLAYAFLGSDHSILLNEGMQMTDEITTVLTHG